jgi:hypothetical protein
MSALDWWRGRSVQEKWMLALIAVLVIGIAVRWAWISSEISTALRERFSDPAEQTTPAEQTSPAEAAPAL